MSARYSVLSVLFFIALLTSLVPNEDVISSSHLERQENDIISNGFTDHDPILITTDSNFTDQGWPGTGIEGDPFIIEGLRIASNETCIDVHNTTSHFVIKNCILERDPGFVDNLFGVLFVNVTNGGIENCTISEKRNGIYFEDATHCYAHNNTISHSEEMGVYAHHVNHCIVTHNMIRYCSRGIGLSWYINNTVVGYNSISGYRWTGMSCWGLGYNSTITHNSIGNPSLFPWFSEGAIDLSAGGWHIEENEFHNDIGIRSWFSSFFYDTPQTIIRNNTFTNCQPAVDFWDVSDVEISGNEVIGGNFGIRLDYCENIEISENTFEDQYLAAIRLYFTFNCTVLDNELVNSGINMDGPNYSSWLHRVSGNSVNGKQLGYFNSVSEIQIDGNEYGQIILVNCSSIEIDGGYFNSASVGVTLAFCKNCTLQNAEVMNNSYCGVSAFYSTGCRFKNSSVHHNSNLYTGGGGFLLSWVVDCVFEHNRIYKNNGTGIENWLDMINCTIINNIIHNNTDYGIAIRRGYGNIIYGNALGWNGRDEESQLVRNALDSGIDNTWDDGVSIGNWWSNYDGEGVYNVSGSSGSFDRFPNTLTHDSIEFPLDNLGTEDFTTLRIIVIIGGAAIIIILMAYYFKAKQEGEV